MSEWQPIDTAPDATDIMVYNQMTGPYMSRKTMIDLDIEYPLRLWDGQFGSWFPKPTHWQPAPLPPPPAENHDG